MARSKWVPRVEMEHILALCTPENVEALRLSMDYGLRIGDVLRIPTSAARAGRWSFKEEKTGKRRRVIFSEEHRRRMLIIAGKLYVFEHRTDAFKHRTRQAVYKDLRRAAECFRYAGISPHTERKIYSVERYKQSGGNMKKVQRLLNHSSEAVTVLYALADEVSRARKLRRRP